MFAKTHPDGPAGFFATEASGLRWLGEAGAVRVPEVLAVTDSELVLPRIESRAATPELMRALGEGLACAYCEMRGLCRRDDWDEVAL